MEIIQIWEAALAAPPKTQLFILCSVLVCTLLSAWLLNQKVWVMGIGMLILHIALAIVLIEISSYNFLVHLVLYIGPSLVLGFFVSLLFSSENIKEGIDWKVRIPTKGGSCSIPIKRGVSISGSAGAGKTDSCFLPIIDHCANQKIGGIIYDYKDGEMGEKILPLFEQSELPIYPIYPSDIRRSYRINPIAPPYIGDMNRVNALAHSFMGNLSVEMKGENQFFFSAAESTLAAIIWRTRESYPDKCNLAYVTAILMKKSVAEIADYIEASPTATLMGKTFLNSMGASKQMAAVQSTISDAMRKVISPQMYWLLSGEDFSLSLNQKDTQGVMLLINHPTYREVFNPFLATLFQSAIMQMSTRGREASAIIIDEGSTIKLNDAAHIPATLRSYDIATVFGIQDMVQGEILYGEKHLRALLANLSSIMVGKTNDPRSSEHYLKMVEEIKKQQKSYTRGKQSSSTVSKKDEKKIKQHEFHQLRTGEFVLFNDQGKSHRVRIKKREWQKQTLPILREVSQEELNQNFHRILDEAQGML